MGHVKFETSVGKYCQDVKIFFQGRQLETKIANGDYIGEYEDDVSTANLEIQYEITKDNNTRYTIVYSCIEDDVDRKDAKKRSPINGKIENRNFKKEIITIALHPDLLKKKMNLKKRIKK